MTQRIVIVGGGVGGTIVANLLARTFHADEVQATLIDSTAQHVYMPMWLYMPFNDIDAESDAVVRPARDLLNGHVHLVTGHVPAIAPKNRVLRVQHIAG